MNIRNKVTMYFAVQAIKTPVERRAELLRLIQTEEDYTGFICALLQTNQKAIVTNILCENPGDFNKEAGKYVVLEYH